MAWTAIGVSALLLTASWHSNHYGYFGRAGQFAFYNDRLAKAEHLAALDPGLLADAYVIGSSNTMPFLPADVQKHFGLGAFNLGTFWGRAEESWAWSNFLLRDLKRPPKLVIFGVEPWTFASDDRGPPLMSMYRRTLLTTPQLVPYLPHYHPLKSRASQVLDSLTIENARLTGRMYSRYGGHRAVPGPMASGGFRSDGANEAYSKLVGKPFLPAHVNDFYKSFVASGPTDEMIETLSEDRKRLAEAWHLRLDEIVNFLPGDRMLTERLELFEKTLAMLNAKGVAVAIMIMPTHPYYFDMLMRYTRHGEHLKRLRLFLDNMALKYPNIEVVFDASNIARFDGDPFAFHDHYHMTPVNTDKVLAAMRAERDKRRGVRP